MSSLWLSYKNWPLKLLFSIRLIAALWSNISDCDEVYNYWEPAYHLIYGQGFQTWEYSPLYALRSYLYILVIILPGWLYKYLLTPNPVYVFYLTRCLLAAISTKVEIYFLEGICSELGVNVAFLTLFILMLSPGMFISATAFLPSSTSMYLAMLSYGSWFKGRYQSSIFFTAVSSLLSWPFASVLGVPIAMDILIRKKKWKLFLRTSLASFVLLLIPLLVTDYIYYGKLVLAPLNIVLYNLFTSHGPNLYGKEPLIFYFLNGVLNFNIFLLVSMLIGPLILLNISSSSARQTKIPLILIYLGFYLWLLLFGIQSHKEERFLFPIYPLFALSGAHALELLLNYFFVSQSHLKKMIRVLVLVIFGVLSVSRILALFQNYHAPMHLWKVINRLPEEITFKNNFEDYDEGIICIGKEWHRYPSSFFLPNNKWRLEFLESEFRGQLPSHYSKNPYSTADLSSVFNDLNLEEKSRYRVSLKDCDYLVDLETGIETDLEPSYSRNKMMTSVASFSFLDSSSCKLFRSFWLPYNTHCKYISYVLLRNEKKMTKRQKENSKPRGEERKKYI